MIKCGWLYGGALALLAVQLPAQEQGGAEVSGNFGIDFTSHYFFRGIDQETRGAIAQPYFDLTFGLYDGQGTIESLDLTIGQWNSLHDGPTGSGGTGQSMWYESDFFAELSAAISGGITLGAVYTAYTSPNGRFTTVQEFGLSAAYDDSAMWGESFDGLQPSVLVAFDLDNNQADGGANRGTYIQLAVEPSMMMVEDRNLTVSVPVTIGLSGGDYYEGTTGDETLGFVDIGVVAGMPLEWMPSRFGPWDGSLGLHALMLGDSNEALNGGENMEFVLTLGFSTSF